MNRNRYRLVFSRILGMLLPVAENAQRQGKPAGTAGAVLVVALGALDPVGVRAELPVPSAGGSIPAFVGQGAAAFQAAGNRAFVNQVGNKAILNWQSFNISPGHELQFRQVDNLSNPQVVPGAAFTSLNRIWDTRPSVIAGSLTQAAGQSANVILVNTNGIAFMGGAQVNLNQFTASSLNIADTFVLNSLLTTQSLTPQFEGSGGFIKVFEGARITAGSQGRVMLLAPTVVNQGRVEAPDGQVIAAAGTKVYLRSASGQDANVRGLLVEVDSPAGLAAFDTPNPAIASGMLDGQSVDLANPAHDALGHATNLGELLAPRGNVTMVGYAVNQQGIARATTSVVANGSVYLLAKDRAVNNAQSTRGGRVQLAPGSLTEVLPELADGTAAPDGNAGAGLERRSQVSVVGQDIRVAAGASIRAPSGELRMAAVDNPSLLGSVSDPFNQAAVAPSATARVHVAAGARIDLAGLMGVEVDVTRNSVEVELRGDELKDSPVNRIGPLRGQKVYVDISRAMANADDGIDGLVARDSLESYQRQTQRTVAERSTAGGTATIQSQGEAILQAGVELDLSGGSLVYRPGLLPTTLLSSGGRLVDTTDARAETRYEAVASRFVVDYGRWNRQEVVDTGETLLFDPGYAEGKAAGSLAVIGMGATVMQADVTGRTTLGDRQRAANAAPAAATLRLGSNTVSGDYKLNQRVELTSTAALLPANFSFGDALPDAAKDVLSIDPGLLGQGRVGHLQVFGNQTARVSEAVRTPDGGSFTLTAKALAVDADIAAPSGVIDLRARPNNVDITAVPLDLNVAAGVSLAARGSWVNDLPSAPARTQDAAYVDGGVIRLSATGDVHLAPGSVIQVDGGAQLRADGRLRAGDGGNVTLEAGAGASALGLHTAAVVLGATVQGHALGDGGSLSINTARIQLGGTFAAGAMQLDPGLLASGGFADINLTGRDGITVAADTVLAPRVLSRELQPGHQLRATGSDIADFTTLQVRDRLQREAANLRLTADGAEVGAVLIGEGSRIQADDGATVALSAGNRIDIQGNIVAPGGTILARLDRSVGFGTEERSTIWVGPDAVLDAAGTAQVAANTQGRQTGRVLDGGTVQLDARVGYVVTAPGSVVRVDGAAPVRIDIAGDTAGAASQVGSDAGTITLAAREGLLLDGTLQARPGGSSNRGGTLEVAYGFADDLNNNFVSPVPRRLDLAPTVAVQTAGSGPESGIAADAIGRARLSVQSMEDAGFDRVALKARDSLRLEAGVDWGSQRALSMREIRLDSPGLVAEDGEIRLAAHTVRIGNHDPERQGSGAAPTTGTGVMRADAQLLELAGDQSWSGLARAELSGVQEIRLTGVATSADPRPAATLQVAADLVLHSAVVAPATYTDYRLDASGHAVTLTGATANPPQPLSVLGSIDVVAQEIRHGGTVWAPFGQISLQAAGDLVLEAGSTTSVAAKAGSTLPFGTVSNGRTWAYTVGGARIDIDDLPQKSIRMVGSKIDTHPGATVDAAGGGTLQAFEFTVGPGGSQDVLAESNTYAILPGFAAGFAPTDPQEDFDRASGESVYLSGVEGLADGVHTLMPARYALLPGAYAVRVNTGQTDVLPGQAYRREDGVWLAAGYLTDSRAGAPRDGRWQGVEVLGSEQVRARSEFTLTDANGFFASSRNRPQDAGLVQLLASGAARDSLSLGATFHLGAAAGGRGAVLDISALNLAIVAGTPAGIDPDATRVEVERINAMGAGSLLLGGTRVLGSDTTLISVAADRVTLANAEGPALQAPEVILAARDTLTLQDGSLVDAQGAAAAPVRYATPGNGALLRAATSEGSFSRTDNPDRSAGVLVSGTGSIVRAADSITLDATLQNAFEGQAQFLRDGVPVAGRLAVGAARINLGDAPGGTAGLTYRQDALDALDSLRSLALTSYSTLDLYGAVQLGGVQADGSPTLQDLSLQGAGLVGIANSEASVAIRARNLSLANPAGVTLTLAGTPGDGTLQLLAETLTLGAGEKALTGFSQVTIQALDVAGEGTGTTLVDADTTLTTARLRGAAGSAQSLRVAGPLSVQGTAAAPLPDAVDVLGAQWTLAGEGLEFGTLAALPSGILRLDSGAGDLLLTPDAHIDVAGRVVRFFDAARSSWAGTAELRSGAGNIIAQPGARLDVSAAPGGDAGTVSLSAPAGTVSLAPGSLLGAARPDSQGARGDGARLLIDAGSVANLPQLLAGVGDSGIDGAVHVRARTGSLVLGESDQIRAQDVQLVADGGRVEIAGQILADGVQGGRIAVHGSDRLTVAGTAQLSARALVDGKDGGSVLLGSATGDVVLAGGSIDTSGAGSGADGTVAVRASRLDGAGASPLHVAIADTGTANNYAVPLSGITASTLLRGMVVSFTPRFSNTGTSRLNLNGAGAKDIFFNGVALTANRIVANQTVNAVYDGTRFHIVDAEFANRTAQPVLASATVTGTTTTNYTATVGGLTSYRAGTTLLYTPPVDNIGTTNRIDVNGLGAKDIRYNNVALPARFLKAGEPVPLVYDGTNFAVALEANTPRATGSATAITVAAPVAPTAGSVLAFTANANNAVGAVTLSVNGIAAPLLRNGAALTSGAFRANDVVYATFDGSNYHVLPELAAKADVGSGVRVTSVAGDYQQPILTRIDGASRIEVEATRTAAPLPIAGGASVLDANRLSADTYRYLPAAERAGTRSVLAGASPLFDADKLHLVPGTVQESSGDILVPRDMNLADYRFGGEPGVLTVRAEGNLLVNNLLSDGFNVATALNGTAPATLAADRSWAYRLVAGADLASANPMAVRRGADGVNDVVIAAGKFIRSGTGAIDIASGNDVRLGDDKSAVYSAGRLSEALTGFTNPANAQFSEAGGDIRLQALGDLRSAERSEQLYANWLFRQGRLATDSASYTTQPAWWVRFDQFQQGVGALGGGDVTLEAGGLIENLSASAPTQARMASAVPDAAALVRSGGGNVRVQAGGDLRGGQYFADLGEVAIRAGGQFDTGQLVGTGTNARPLYPVLALADSTAKVQARDAVQVHAILNPYLVVQSSGSGANFNINNAASPLWSLFSTYGEDSAASLTSLSGAVLFHNAPAGSGTLASMTSATGAYRTPLNFSVSSSNYSAARALGVLPPNMDLVSLQSDVAFGGVQSTMQPAPFGQLSLLAAGSVRLPLTLNLSDLAPLPDAVQPAANTGGLAATTLTAHAAQPVHAQDNQPARLYARDGSVTGVPGRLNLNSAKPVSVLAGQDVLDLGLSIQHVQQGSVSRIEAGQDIRFSSGESRASGSYVWVAGPGRLEVSAGRHVDLGTSAGIVSRGNLDNPALPAAGADLQVAAGLGSRGLDAGAALDRLVASLEQADPADASSLWLARWLTGDDALLPGDALAAVRSLRMADAELQRSKVREMLFTALRQTGRDATRAESPFAADYSRGYAALELVFPGISEKDSQGEPLHYRGDVNLFASRLLTEAGGNIEFLAPGGDVIVGLANTPASLVATQVPGAGIGLTDSGVLGIAVVAAGDIKGFALKDVLVNQSRVLTVGGGDVLLWSSEGDIDAGKGKKTAAVVPPPLILVDSQGNVTQVLQGAATGSGIGALSTGGTSAGDVDLIAPRGTVNAGDAGIRAGNLNIAAQVVLGADNISVSGSTTGAPVADTSAVTAAASGATGGVDEAARTTAALAQSAAESAKVAQQVLPEAFRPSIVRVDVLGFGE
jgi:filamentous hemagglutinin family protein